MLSQENTKKINAMRPTKPTTPPPPTDPIKDFRELYNNKSQNAQRPTIYEIIKFRKLNRTLPLERFNSLTVLSPASEKIKVENQLITAAWSRNHGSMLYVIKNNKYPGEVNAEPMCLETGMFPEYHHLRKLKLTKCSVDTLNSTKVTAAGKNLGWTNSLFVGDVICVQEVGRCTPRQVGQEDVYYVKQYYVVTRKILNCERALAVMQERYNASPKTLTKHWEIYPVGQLQHCGKTSISEEYMKRILDNTHKKWAGQKEPIRSNKTTKKNEQIPPILMLTGVKLFLPNTTCNSFAANISNDYTNQKLLELYYEASQTYLDDVKGTYLPPPELLSYKDYFLVEDCLRRGDEFLQNRIHFCQAMRSVDHYSNLVFTARETRIILFQIEKIQNGRRHHGVNHINLVSRQKNVSSLKTGLRVKMFGIPNVNVPVVAQIATIVPKQDGSFEVSVSIPLACGLDASSSDQVVTNGSLRESVRQYFSDADCLQKHLYLTEFVVESFDKLQTVAPNSSKMKNVPKMAETSLTECLFEGLRKSHNDNHVIVAPEVEKHETQSVQSKFFDDCFRKCFGPDQPTAEQIAGATAIFNKNMHCFHVAESPFGSGKSMALAAAIVSLALTSSENKIWVCAPSNNAVTNLRKLIVKCMDKSGVDTTAPTKDSPIRLLLVRSRAVQDVDMSTVCDVFELANVRNAFYINGLRDMNKSEDPKSPSKELYRHMWQALCSAGLETHARNVIGEEKMKEVYELGFPEEKKPENELDTWFASKYRPNIFLTTVDMLVKSDMRKYFDMQPDYVFFDEAGSIKATDMYLIAGMLSFNVSNVKRPPIHFAMTGDKHQLVPFSRIRSIDRYTISVNTALDAVSQYVPEIQLMYTGVFRTHPSNVRIMSDAFYRGNLKSFNKKTRQDFLQCHINSDDKMSADGLDIPLFLPGGHGATELGSVYFVLHEHQHSKGGHSLFNKGEADLVERYCFALREKMGDNLRGKTVAVISPYQAQKGLFESTRDEGALYDVIQTIRSYRGMEADVVLVSLTASSFETTDGHTQHPTINGRDPALLIKDQGMMLVGLTRARHFTVVFCNKNLLTEIDELGDIYSNAMRPNNISNNGGGRGYRRGETGMGRGTSGTRGTANTGRARGTDNKRGNRGGGNLSRGGSPGNSSNYKLF